MRSSKKRIPTWSRQKTGAEGSGQTSSRRKEPVIHNDRDPKAAPVEIQTGFSRRTARKWQ
jgi:hypothetical protein